MCEHSERGANFLKPPGSLLHLLLQLLFLHPQACLNRLPRRVAQLVMREEGHLLRVLVPISTSGKTARS